MSAQRWLSLLFHDVVPMPRRQWCSLSLTAWWFVNEPCQRRFQIWRTLRTTRSPMRHAAAQTVQMLERLGMQGRGIIEARYLADQFYKIAKYQSPCCCVAYLLVGGPGPYPRLVEVWEGRRCRSSHKMVSEKDSSFILDPRAREGGPGDCKFREGSGPASGDIGCRHVARGSPY